MNKKGEQVSEELGGVTMAAIGILLLSLAAYSIYLHIQVSRESSSEAAQKTMEILGDKLDVLDVGESGQITIQGFTDSENWYLTGWDLNDADRPERCFFESCVCICDNILCNEKLFCYKSDSEQIDVVTYYVAGDPSAYIKLEKGILLIDAFRYNQAYIEIDSLRLEYCKNVGDSKCVKPDLGNFIVQNE